MNIFFLHGFLGVPHDWNQVVINLPKSEETQIHLIDYFNREDLNSRLSFSHWANNLNAWAKTLCAPDEKNILVGYSLGGRLALHALEADSHFWDQCFCFSTNPGFPDGQEGYSPQSKERSERLLADKAWAQKFLMGSWAEAIASWNSQAVFAGGAAEPERLEKNYDKDILAGALIQWSHANQKDLRAVIRQYHDKIYWFVGEKDKKYLQISEELKLRMPEFSFEVIANSSHRILWDQPSLVAKRLSLAK